MLSPKLDSLGVRPLEAEDAAELYALIDANRGHLARWMPWAAEEPKPVEEKAQLLRSFRGRFDLDEDFVYGIFTPDEHEVIGGTGLHTRVGPGALEIGYWIRASRTGNGYAREATAALTKAAFRACAVDRVEIRVDPKRPDDYRLGVGPNRYPYEAVVTGLAPGQQQNLVIRAVDESAAANEDANTAVLTAKP